MSAAAKRKWAALAPRLERLGLLTEADADTFGAYCEAWSRYVDACRRLRRVLRTNPEDAVSIRKAEVSVEKAEHSMRLLAMEFGLSPAARSRIDLPPQDEDDDFERFLSQGQER
ncbi:MAG: phage terminase small subunit P27 family [Firmicutes bacterium]|nr:phage terminase small subunit P27 family [Bacillota bacterium]